MLKETNPNIYDMDMNYGKQLLWIVISSFIALLILLVDEKLFYRVVKTAFQQRRKTLRNSLKTMNLSDNLREDSIFAKRPEQLSVQEFINLTSKIEKDAI